MGGREQGAGSSHDNTPIVVAPFALMQNQRGELRTSDVQASLGGMGGKPGEGYPCVVAIQERAFAENPLSGPDGMGARDDGTAYTVEARSPQNVAIDELGVRMLTPIECERIMGWPDDHTRFGLDEKGKLYELKDSPRYQLCGNGEAKEWGEWILRRLVSLEAGVVP